MKILYLHQYFKTPAQGGAVRSYYLAKALIDHGHEVEMITSHNKSTYTYEVVEGIKVHYLPVYYHNRLGFLGRVWAFLRFMFVAYHRAKSIKDIELCYATSTPLSVGWIALRLLKKHQIPYYFEVRDLWPEAPVQLGYLRNRWLIGKLYDFERKIYQNASKLIALSPGMRVGIEDKVPGRYASMLPNMADCEFFQMEAKQEELLDKYNVRGKFVVAYTGALGKVNDVESIVRLAKHCQKAMPNIHFLIAGDGGELCYLKAEMKSHQLGNMSYLGLCNKGEIKEILNVSDVSLVSFGRSKVLETNSPNKFFDGIAAGKLIAVNTQGWIKEMIEAKQCGFYFDPLNPAEFVVQIQKYMDDRTLLLAAQTNARKLAENYFSRTEITRNFVKLFDGTHQMDTVISSVYTLTA